MKYHNKKTEVDGIIFDSKKEAQRYAELKLLERAGKILNLILQPTYELQPSFKKDGKTIRAITYTPDFGYLENGKGVVEDVKGMVTERFRIKAKLFNYKYPDLTLKIV